MGPRGFEFRNCYKQFPRFHDPQPWVLITQSKTLPSYTTAPTKNKIIENYLYNYWYKLKYGNNNYP